MTHPLRDLALKLERRKRRLQRQHALDAALTNRHFARDLDLKHRARQHRLYDF